MLEPGKQYKDNYGSTVSIAGPTRDHPQWVYSIQGGWYDKETGAFIMFTRTKGHYVLPVDALRSISNHTPIAKN